MNLPALVFALIAFSVLKFMIIGDINGQPEDLEVPAFPSDFCPSLFSVGEDDGIVNFDDDPNNDENDDCTFRSPECGNVVYLCIDYLGDVLYNIGIAVIVFFTFFFLMIGYFVQLIAFLGRLVVRSLQPLDSAPWYVNILLLTPQTF